MKECSSCHNKVEELAHTCPRCGGQEFIMSLSNHELSSVADAMKKQELAAQHVNRGHELFKNGRRWRRIAGHSKCLVLLLN
jgi:RNA polymerase subunit RPABC4/transcription elongation factor Spt4